MGTGRGIKQYGKLADSDREAMLLYSLRQDIQTDDPGRVMSALRELCLIGLSLQALQDLCCVPRVTAVRAVKAYRPNSSSQGRPMTTLGPILARPGEHLELSVFAYYYDRIHQLHPNAAPYLLFLDAWRLYASCIEVPQVRAQAAYICSTDLKARRARLVACNCGARYVRLAEPVRLGKTMGRGDCPTCRLAVMIAAPERAPVTLYGRDELVAERRKRLSEGRIGARKQGTDDV